MSQGDDKRHARVLKLLNVLAPSLAAALLFWARRHPTLEPA